MPVHFFDTIAISKHCHAETGTAKVELLDLPNASQVISRWSVVELQSVFAKASGKMKLTAASVEA